MVLFVSSQCVDNLVAYLHIIAHKNVIKCLTIKLLNETKRTIFQDLFYTR